MTRDTPIEFKVVRWRHGIGQAQEGKVTVFLESNSWNDRGYQTLFTVHVVGMGLRAKPGDIKILHASADGTEDRVTVLPRKFESLPRSQYYSLGQSIDYYSWMRNAGDIGKRILEALADFTTHNQASHGDWSKLRGWSISLLRFSDARKALEEAHLVLAGKLQIADFSFRYETQFEGADAAHSLSFVYEPSESARQRVNVLIGPNGSGKSSLLSSIASDLSDGVSLKKAPERLFSRQILVSQSAFDARRRPSARGKSSFRYVGPTWPFEDLLKRLRDHLETSQSSSSWPPWWTSEFPSPTNLMNLLTGEYEAPPAEHLVALQESKDEWHVVLNPAGLSDEAVDELIENPTATLPRLSAGQQSVIRMLAGISYHLDQESIVLVDEPESHLHPAMLTGLMRAMTALLEQRQSFAIVATHSPLILRDVPTECVSVVSRQGNTPFIRRPAIQTFGASLPAITMDVFGVQTSHAQWRATMAHLLQGNGAEEVEHMFKPGLTAEARTHLRHMAAGHELWDEEESS